ncbi:hypothetical protein FNF28_01436 [Cafeteria roenbergensis]|uniref:C2H2-type domain-containing protein n=1 Tax=Cafeteria roenbergensis TaxID=33653 RepID=A0A5A8DY61_CAFRO|nr:hypothetical protein FNF28_01436 [Cafeteria roenbergensis]
MDDEGARPTCTRCGRTFARPSFLREHIIQVHERLRRFRCMLCGASYLQRAHANKHVAAAHPERDPASSSGHERIIRKLSDAEARRARDLGEDTSGLRRHRRTSPSMTSTQGSRSPTTAAGAADTLPVATLRTPKDEALANLGARLTPGQLPSAVVFGHSAAGL